MAWMRTERLAPEPSAAGHGHHTIMDSIGQGVIAGFVATFAMSMLHDPIAVLTAAIGVQSPAVGWLFHFFVGTVLWGSGFGLLYDHMPGPSWMRGVVFGLGVSLVVMLVVMPMVGTGWFGLRLGFAAPVAVVALHLVYGAILGAIYGVLSSEDEEHERRPTR